MLWRKLNQLCCFYFEEIGSVKNIKGSVCAAVILAFLLLSLLGASLFSQFTEYDLFIYFLFIFGTIANLTCIFTVDIHSFTFSMRSRKCPSDIYVSPFQFPCESSKSPPNALSPYSRRHANTATKDRLSFCINIWFFCIDFLIHSSPYTRGALMFGAIDFSYSWWFISVGDSWQCTALRHWTPPSCPAAVSNIHLWQFGDKHVVCLYPQLTYPWTSSIYKASFRQYFLPTLT